MSKKPTIRLPRTREIREREDRFQMVRLANLLVEKWGSPKLHWTLNCAHPFDFWTTTYSHEGRTYTIKLDMALSEVAGEDTPHQWRLSLLTEREYGYGHWEVLDPLVGHEALEPLIELLAEKDREVSDLIQKMIWELETMAA